LANRFRKKGVVIHQTIEPNLPEVLGYSGQLSQVLINILANALDALEEKQELLAVNLDSPQVMDWQPQINIRVFSRFSDLDHSQDWVCIEIQDNANGIPEAVQKNMFKDFFTTKSLGKGTGLGLAISHDIIQQKHQGRLKFQSILGQGTTFAIWLPVEWSAGKSMSSIANSLLPRVKSEF
jgi:signal transduction histidine kinase